MYSARYLSIGGNIYETIYCIYHATKKAIEKTKKVSSEDMRKVMADWMKWKKKCGRSLVDIGHPVGKGQRINRTSSAPSKNGVVGYSIIKANNLTGAKKLLKNHPHLNWTRGCSLDVLECHKIKRS